MSNPATWLLTRLVIEPLVAERRRRDYEYGADQDARRAGLIALVLETLFAVETIRLWAGRQRRRGASDTDPN